MEEPQSNGDFEFLQTIQEGISLIQAKLPEATILLSALISKRSHKLWPKVKAINSKLQTLCMENDIIFVDQENILKNPKLVKKDGIHLTKPHGVEQLALSIKRNIPRMLYPRSSSVPRGGRSHPIPKNHKKKFPKKK